MKYTEESYLTLLKDCTTVVYAINGSLKKDGTNVMGKGLGKTIATSMPNLPDILGRLIATRGLSCYSLFSWKLKLIAFPTKYNYWEEESLDLIKESLAQLIELIGEDETIIMEFPYYGNDQEKINQIKEVLNNLDERFTICL
jgi:hypothetical protein